MLYQYSQHIDNILGRYNFVIFLSLGTTVATTTTSLPSPTTTEVSTPCDDVNLMTDSRSNVCQQITKTKLITS
jgi:hypothetical protein